MREGWRRASGRARATFALAAVVAAAVLGVGAALAHVGGFLDQTATRGFGGISNVDHAGVPPGQWTFDVVAMDGRVRDLTLAIKLPCVGGTLYYYNQIKKPTLDTVVTTPVIDADGDPTTDDDYCSQVAFPGAGNSITVRVSHP